MNQRHRDVSGVPVGDVFACPDFPCLRETLLNAVQVMLEPVRYQQWFSIGSFNQILQCVQLLVVNLYDGMVLSVGCSIGHLTQFSGQGGGVHRVNLLTFYLHDQVSLHSVVDFTFPVIHSNNHPVFNPLRHLQVIRCPHGNRHVTNAPVDFLFRTRPGCVGEDLLLVPFVREEEGITVMCNKSSQPFAQIQNPELCPQIHQAVAAGRSCQTDDALHVRPHFQQTFESFCLPAFEGRKLVNHNHVEGEGNPAVFHQPLDVFPVDDEHAG